MRKGAVKITVGVLPAKIYLGDPELWMLFFQKDPVGFIILIKKELFACNMKLHNHNFVTTANEKTEEPDSFYAAK